MVETNTSETPEAPQVPEPPAADAASGIEPDGAASDSKPNKKWIKRLIFLLYLLVLVELGCRGYFSMKRGTSFIAPNVGQILYPEIPELTDRATPISSQDDTIDVLFLGGSVLDRRHGDIGIKLEKSLAAATGRDVVVHNMAHGGHTSLDSLGKYRILEDHRFDLVFVYHAINEARFNNCPPQVWRDDYTHVGRYRRIASVASHPEFPWFVTPYAFRYLGIKLAERMGTSDLMPRGDLTDAWLQYGNDIKTAKPFRANLSAIAKIAEERGDRLMLVTYAFYLPEGYDYQKKAFEQPEGVSDYAGDIGSGIDVMGRPGNVVATIQKHNEIVRSIVGAQPRVATSDIAGRMPRGGKLFKDVCHLTPSGDDRFVEIIVPDILPLVKRKAP